ncbi:hypothetical protein DFJ73DRAFT_809774 [Zopfochytrium polystomum]|nr:hypothetical protein DFJ73DRAFT_809774 [Zopfochytrium polystomum]
MADSATIDRGPATCPHPAASSSSRSADSASGPAPAGDSLEQDEDCAPLENDSDEELGSASPDSSLRRPLLPTQNILDPSSPTKPNLPTQAISLDDELCITVTGYRVVPFYRLLFHILSFLSCGLLLLLCRWFPRLRLRIVAEKCDFAQASMVLVDSSWKEHTIVDVETLPIELESLRDIFPGVRSAQESAWALGSSRKPNETAGDHGQLRFFNYRFIKFMLNPYTGMFEVNMFWRDPNWRSVSSVLCGVDDQVVPRRRLIFGDNEITIKEKSTLNLLLDEVLHPFFVFQVASMILWSLDSYYYYAACILVITIMSTVSTLTEMKEAYARLRNLSKFSCNVRVWRGSRWCDLSSEDLVPGDVFEVGSAMAVVPCDAVLLDGDCITNESMLTGESVPVAKYPVTDEDLQSLDFENEDPSGAPRMSKFFLFSGTKVIRARSGALPGASATPGNSEASLHFDDFTGEPGAVALAVRTGFNTTKGALIRSIQFPKPHTFQFYRDSFRFIGVLGMIAAVGFSASLYNSYKFGESWTDIFVRALDLITIIIPPALPATMAVGVSFSISRLRKAAIYCISPPRVNICGKVEVMCFDKTGTLTEEGLDVLGFRCAVSENESDTLGASSFSDLYKVADLFQDYRVTTESKSALRPAAFAAYWGNASSPDNPDLSYPIIICAMACCHSLKVVNGDLIGDPMDVKMFEFTDWQIEEGTSSSETPNRHSGPPGLIQFVVRPTDDLDFETCMNGSAETDSFSRATSGRPRTFTELGVVRSFEFVSRLRRMSVVARRIHYARGDQQTSGNESASVASSSTSPISLASSLNGVSIGSTKEFEVFVKGAPEVIRSICATSSLPPDYDSLLRQYAHRGFRVIAIAWRRLENISWLKLMKMKREEIESNLEFLGFVVFENKLKPETSPVIGHLRKARIRQVMCTGDNLLTAVSVARECGLVQSEGQVFVPRIDESGSVVWEDLDDEENENGTRGVLDPVALTTLQESSPEFDLAITGDVFQTMLESASENTFHRLLVKAQVFARMSPEQKHLLVERLQDIGYCVGFCGDGANDCGALKGADVGVSLSEAEASVAAPFTSQATNVSCVLQLIREGRAALVTSFGAFKFMAAYSLIQFTTVSLMYSMRSNLADFQFLFIDMAVIIPVAIFMSESGPNNVINPKRPTASLVSKKVLTSMLGQVLLQVSFQAVVFFWVRSMDWYLKPDRSKGRFQSFENTCVFLLSCFQYIFVAAVFCVGPPHRESIWRNYRFVATAVLLTGILVWLTLSPSALVVGMFDLRPPPLRGRLWLLSFIALDGLLTFVFERWVVSILASAYTAVGMVVRERLTRRYRRRPADVEAVDALDRRRQHRRDKWERKGKLYKVIEDDMRR